MTEEAIKKYITEQSEESREEDSEGAAFAAVSNKACSTRLPGVQVMKAPRGAKSNHHLKWWLVTFKGDSKTKLIAKAVKVRNKVDHVNAKTVNVMSGKQCGFYIYKFSLLYRYIMLQEIGIEDKIINLYINEWIENFNNQYPQLRV